MVRSRLEGSKSEFLLSGWIGGGGDFRGWRWVGLGGHWDKKIHLVGGKYMLEKSDVSLGIRNFRPLNMPYLVSGFGGCSGAWQVSEKGDCWKHGEMEGGWYTIEGREVELLF